MTDSTDLDEMTDDEAEAHITSVLREGGRLTTRELELEIRETGKRCPDSAVSFLMRLRAKGLISGEVSVERGGWVWWLRDG